MKINSLEITNFRNFEHVAAKFSHRINLFYGENGSGKTSLLEAIHYLGLGRSFRTRNISRLIHNDKEGFSLFAQLAQQNGGDLAVGVERRKDTPHAKIRIGREPAKSLVELAEILPLQLINADSHLLLTSGPLVRRQFLDWGVFHVEPSFYLAWHRANRLIKQRNAALKTASSYKDIASWDDELDKCSRQLDAYRREYVTAFQPSLYSMLHQLLAGTHFTLQYYCGWNSQKLYREILESGFYKDKQMGFTQQGPHRADLQLKIGNIPAADILSQGQQKLAAYALRLSQGALLYSQKNKASLYLIDDLPSELDRVKRKLIAEVINDFQCQMFVTGIEQVGLKDLMEINESRMFHVERGRLAASSLE